MNGPGSSPVPDPVLIADDIGHRFGAKAVLAGVNFSLDAASFCAKVRAACAGLVEGRRTRLTPTSRSPQAFATCRRNRASAGAPLNEGPPPSVTSVMLENPPLFSAPMTCTTRS